jgi:hypothetical protein
MSVTPDTIAVALGRTTYSSVEEEQWQMFIDDAEMLIEARRVELEIEDTLDEARVDYVVRESVVAHIRQPDNATQVTVSVDDASTSRTYKSGKGRVVVLEDLWPLLGLTSSSEGAFSVDTVSTTSAHLPWCAYTLGANYCSCGVDIAGYPIYELWPWP